MCSINFWQECRVFLKFLVAILFNGKVSTLIYLWVEFLSTSRVFSHLSCKIHPINNSTWPLPLLYLQWAASWQRKSIQWEPGRLNYSIYLHLGLILCSNALHFVFYVLCTLFLYGYCLFVFSLDCPPLILLSTMTHQVLNASFGGLFSPDFAFLFCSDLLMQLVVTLWLEKLRQHSSLSARRRWDRHLYFNSDMEKKVTTNCFEFKPFQRTISNYFPLFHRVK